MATQTLTEESTSRYVQAGDIRLHYNEAGSGEAVVMIHGGGPGASGWSNFRTNIGAFSETYRTMLLDMPQYGKSDPVVIDGDATRYNAVAIKAMFDELGIDKAHFIGNSFGGATSLRFAIEYPERVGKLIVMGPAGSGPSYFMPRPLEGIKALNAWWDNPSREQMAKIVDLFVYDEKFKTDELIDMRHNAGLSRPQHIEARRNSTNRVTPDFTSELHKVQAKTLIIWGRDDRFSPLDFALNMLWRIPDAQVHVFPECGHWVQYEKSDEFNRLIMDFIAND
ncbi:MAG: alpha/beta fold hydrolase [Dehalococcoidia bacterium]|nr:alpha/beta fold hydrolase [Dehalococcoidia bacterium]